MSSNAAATGAGSAAKIRRRYKVDKLPLKVQQVIFRGYGRGDSYPKIRAAVQAESHDISENSLSRYWRNVW